jgi:hypothetical protein
VVRLQCMGVANGEKGKCDRTNLRWGGVGQVGSGWVRLMLVDPRATPELKFRPTYRRRRRRRVTPDARHCVHSYSRLLSDLFVVKGLK